MSVTEAEFNQWVPIIIHQIRWMKDHPDWEDIRQEALIAGWVAANSGKGNSSPRTAAIGGAKWGALDFLRFSRQCQLPFKSTRSRPEFISISSMDKDGVEYDMPEVSSEDFVPNLIYQMNAKAISEWAYQQMSPLEVRIVRGLMSGALQEELADELGYKMKTVDNARRRAITKCRERWAEFKNE